MMTDIIPALLRRDSQSQSARTDVQMKEGNIETGWDCPLHSQLFNAPAVTIGLECIAEMIEQRPDPR